MPAGAVASTESILVAAAPESKWLTKKAYVNVNGSMESHLAPPAELFFLSLLRRCLVQGLSACLVTLRWVPSRFTGL